VPGFDRRDPPAEPLQDDVRAHHQRVHDGVVEAGVVIEDAILERREGAGAGTVVEIHRKRAQVTPQRSSVAAKLDQAIGQDAAGRTAGRFSDWGHIHLRGKTHMAGTADQAPARMSVPRAWSGQT
jgi:hypothetical protein